MYYTNLVTDQSNEIHLPKFWCYFDPHRNTFRMSNDPRTRNPEKQTTPVTIAPVKASLNKINRKVERRYRHWLDIHKLWNQCLKIPEVISKGGEKEYMF